MEDKIIKLATAKLAKEKGFKEKTFFSYEINRNNNFVLCWGEFLGRPPVNEGGYKVHPKYKLNNHNSNKQYKVYSAPTQSLLQRWLREVHDIHIEIIIWDNNTWSAQIVGDSFENNDDEYEASGCKTYEEALEIGLQEALKLIKEK